VDAMNALLVASAGVCIGPINEIPVKPVPRVIKKKKKMGLPLWKQQHLDFINNVRYAKKMKDVESRGGDVRSVKAPVQYHDPTADYKMCPYCGRKFAQQVAERHIPSCKNTINKPKPPPNMGMQSKVGRPAGGYCSRCGGKLIPGRNKCTFCG
jgi:NADH pyrophosphatase NudC (nudix superfamily)